MKLLGVRQQERGRRRVRETKKLPNLAFVLVLLRALDIGLFQTGCDDFLQKCGRWRNLHTRFPQRFADMAYQL